MKGLQEMHLAKLRRPHRTGIKSVSTACKTSTITLYYSPPPQPQDWLLILQIVLPLNSKCFPTSMPTSNLVWLNHTHTHPHMPAHSPNCTHHTASKFLAMLSLALYNFEAILQGNFCSPHWGLFLIPGMHPSKLSMHLNIEVFTPLKYFYLFYMNAKIFHLNILYFNKLPPRSVVLKCPLLLFVTQCPGWGRIVWVRSKMWAGPVQ